MPLPQSNPNECPCCGQQLSAEMPLRLDLGTNTIFVRGRAISLTPKAAEFAAVLMKVMPGAMHRNRIHAAIYGRPENGGPEVHIVPVIAYQLRQALKGSGFTVKTHGYAGYSLHMEAT